MCVCVCVCMRGRWAPRREESGRPEDGEEAPTPTPSSHKHIPRASPPRPLSSTWQRTFLVPPTPKGADGVWASRPHQGDNIPEGSASHICFFISVSLACFLPRGTRSLKSCGATLPQHLPPQLVVGGAWGGWGRLHLVLPPGLGSSPPWGPPQTFLFPATPSNPQLVHRRLTP